METKIYKIHIGNHRPMVCTMFERVNVQFQNFGLFRIFWILVFPLFKIWRCVRSQTTRKQSQTNFNYSQFKNQSQ
jgi:hypothetical protein